jgi:hypothetical protein
MIWKTLTLKTAAARLAESRKFFNILYGVFPKAQVTQDIPIRLDSEHVNFEC